MDSKNRCTMEGLTLELWQVVKCPQKIYALVTKGIWQMIFNTLAVDADTEWLMIDSTIVRAHQHAAGAKGGRKIKR